MNTFGALKYLEAEQSVVEEITLNLKDQLNKLKIEELAIRASIRRTRMKEGQADAVDLDNLGDLDRSLVGDGAARMSGAAQHRMNTLPSTSSTNAVFESGEAKAQPEKQNMPIEVSINEALEMISRYRNQDPLAHPGADALDALGEESYDDTEMDEAEMSEETGLDEQFHREPNPDMEFLDLRNAAPDDDEQS